MTLRPRIIALLLGCCAIPSALAIGLGNPATAPIIGQPLRIDIPLTISSGEPLPSADCIKLIPPGDSPDRQFFPRNARVSVDGGSRPRIRIQSSDSVTEPLIEFRISIGCGTSFSRDFLVLTDAPGSSHATPVSHETERTAPANTAPSPATPTRIVESAGPVLRLTQDTTLNALARSRYPTNQATRDEYRRLMAAANPELFAGIARVGSVPLAAGTVLSVPSNLPPLEQAQVSVAADEATPPAKAKRRQTAETEADSAATPAPRARRQDRLVIGGDSAATLAKGPSARELAETVDRLEKLLADQGQAEQRMLANLDTLNTAFGETKNYVQTLEARLKALDAAHRDLLKQIESKPEPKSLGVLEFLALILTAGVMGAALLALHHRLQVQRNDAGYQLSPTSDIDLNDIGPDFPEVVAPAEPPVDDTPVTRSPEPPPVAIKVAEKPPIPAFTPAPPPSAVPPAPTFEPPSYPAPAALDRGLEPPRTRDDSFASVDFEAPAAPIPPMAELDIPAPNVTAAATGNPHQDALELAGIMMTMGMTEQASKTLLDQLLADPKRDLGPWLAALDNFRKTGQREKFEWLAEAARQHLNILPVGWDEDFVPFNRSLMDFRHIAKQLVSLWPRPECSEFLAELLSDTREGSRQGFPQYVAEEIATLQFVLAEIQADQANA